MTILYKWLLNDQPLNYLQNENLITSTIQTYLKNFNRLTFQSKMFKLIEWKKSPVYYICTKCWIFEMKGIIGHVTVKCQIASVPKYYSIRLHFAEIWKRVNSTLAWKVSDVFVVMKLSVWRLLNLSINSLQVKSVDLRSWEFCPILRRIDDVVVKRWSSIALYWLLLVAFEL